MGETGNPIGRKENKKRTKKEQERKKEKNRECKTTSENPLMMTSRLMDHPRFAKMGRKWEGEEKEEEEAVKCLGCC